MAKVKYWLERLTPLQEKTVREFLLRKGDTLRLTRSSSWTEFKWLWIVRHGTDKDAKVMRVKESLKPEFKKKIINNKLYDDASQWKFKYSHYFFRLSAPIKKKLQEETLLWNMFPPTSKNFFGFEDPTFYKEKEMIGGVVSHERYIFLCLTHAEKKALEKKK